MGSSNDSNLCTVIISPKIKMKRVHSPGRLDLGCLILNKATHIAFKCNSSPGGQVARLLLFLLRCRSMEGLESYSC